ncbi:MAG: hypothetical protein H0U74_05075 [Bradymonadaceae bacterium]|nr:hypothetical protein [Lujinxingiaceae bacterium]
MNRFVCSTLLFSLLIAAPALASDHAGVVAGLALQTLPPDGGYGTQPLREAARFEDFGEEGTAADRRARDYALSERVINLPSATTMEQGTWLASSFNFMGNQLAYAGSDDVLWALGVVLPAYGDFYTLGSAKWAFFRSQDIVVSLMPFTAYRSGSGLLKSSDWGIGASLLADLVVTERLVLNGGVIGHASIFNSATAARDYSACASRADYLRGDCITTSSLSSFAPPGGHWLAAYVGTSYFALSWLSLHTEFVASAFAGDFLEKRRFRRGQGVFATPFGAGFAGAGGVGLHFGDLSLQMAIYASDSTALPSVTAAYKF